MSHPDDYDLNVPKKWVSRKNDQPEQTLTSTHHPMVGIDVGDVPESEKCKVLDSISRALAEQLRPMIVAQ